MVGGWAADVGYYVHGRKSEFSVNDDIGDNANWGYGAFNGFDHFLSFSVRTKIARRLSFGLVGTGESSTIAGFLFRPVPTSLVPFQNSADPSEPKGGPLGNTVPLWAFNSPLSLSVFGTRWRTASAGAELTFSQSGRLTWHLNTDVTRNLPSETHDTGSGQSVLYPGVTSGLVSAGLSYSLSRRAWLTLGMDYTRSYSAYGQFQVGSGVAGIRQLITRQWFMDLEAGYGVLSGRSSLQSGVGTYLKPTYRGAVDIGTNMGANTFFVAARRDIGDTYGLGSQSAVGADGAWTWRNRNNAWTLTNSVGYQRVAGNGVNPIEGWIYQGTISRQMNRHLKLIAQAVYAGGRGYGSGISNLTSRGGRLSLVWGPGTRGTR
jgi:hypothetical protein